MRRRGEAIGSVLALGAALLLVAFAPIRAEATDSDLKHAYAFKLKASNGYSILAYAGSERADGLGEIVLFVQRKDAGAIYQARATVTANRLDADLGELGKVALDVVPSGRERTVGLPCDSESGPTRYEPQLFSGGFEFHGEEGYTEAVSSAPKEYTRFFLGLFCAGGSSGAVLGRDLPGARLRLRAHRGPFRLDVQVNKNRPGARTRFEVDVHERREAIFISRSRTVWMGADAFRYDRELRTATIEPPTPFAGRASFHRGGAGGGTWAGNLTVDMPGRSKLPLAGSGVGATLVRSCWHEGEGRFRC